MTRFLYIVVFLFLLVSNGMTQEATEFKRLNFRFIGPEGNRAIAIAGVQGNPMINYIGAASGGLWKTTDGGLSWESIFDDNGVSSIGSIAIDPLNPNTVWAGTGETFVIRPAHAMGDGIYKSTDAGKPGRIWAFEKQVVLVGLLCIQQIRILFMQLPWDIHMGRSRIVGYTRPQMVENHGNKFCL